LSKTSEYRPFFVVAAADADEVDEGALPDVLASQPATIGTTGAMASAFSTVRRFN
jgi:hypothetical protein